MSTKLLAANEWNYPVNPTDYGYKKRMILRVRGELIHYEGNSEPHFSLTAEVRKTWACNDKVVACGRLVDEIKHYGHGKFDALALVHSSTDKGVPMHAEGNARYWAGLSKWSDGRYMSPGSGAGNITDDNGIEWNPDMLASHLQTGNERAYNVRQALVKGESWESIVESFGFTELWADQAHAARALLREVTVQV